MKAVEFPEQTVVLAKGQPQYQSLPVHIDETNPMVPMTFCMELDAEELKQINETGRIWLSQCTFGNHFQPMNLSCKNPF